jgi:hypothetical protein
VLVLIDRVVLPPGAVPAIGAPRHPGSNTGQPQSTKHQLTSRRLQQLRQPIAGSGRPPFAARRRGVRCCETGLELGLGLSQRPAIARSLSHPG